MSGCGENGLQPSPDLIDRESSDEFASSEGKKKDRTFSLQREIPEIGTRIKTGLSNGFRTSFLLLKVVLPLYVAVSLVKETDIFNAIGRQFEPIMGLFDLPGEAAFAFIAAFLINIYAAMAILVPLDLTPWQITECGLMMGIAHELIVEGGVLVSAGMRGGLLTLFRLVVMVVCGLLLTASSSFWLS